MTANHIERSRGWYTIKSLLNLSTRSSTDSQKFYSLEEQQNAEDLATFLMYSALTTLPLDRQVVSALLQGNQLWERNGEFVSINNGIDIEYLEKSCLVIFEADWLLLTCKLEENIEKNVDKSLIPVIKTLRTLYNIQYGRDGYKKPTLFVSDEIWNREFTNNSSIITYIERENNTYILGEKYDLNPLVSTFLWQKLLANSVSSKDAFEQWLRIMRLTCSVAFPILEYVVSDLEYNMYTTELKKHLLSDIPFPMDIERSILNYSWFSEYVRNFTPLLSMSMEISVTRGETNSKDEYAKQLRKNVITKESLPSFSLHQVSQNEFSIINTYLGSRIHQEGPGGFYSWIVSAYIEKSINIDSSFMSYSDDLIELIQFVLKHPLLKHIFFCEIFKLQLLPNYFCFLLSRVETCNFAMFWFASWYKNKVVNIGGEIFFEELEIIISKKYANTNNNIINYDEQFLDVVFVLAHKLNIYKEDAKKSKHFSLFDNFLKHQSSNALFSMIDLIENVDLGKHFYPSGSVFNVRNHMYFLLWWLYDFIDKNALDIDQVYIRKIVGIINDELKNDIVLNCQGKKSNLNATELFRQFPWHKIIIEDGGERFLSISKQYRKEWLPALSWTNNSQSNIRGAICCYFQILMVAANHDSCQHLNKIHKRAMSIADCLGFDSTELNGLFFSYSTNSYDLWSDFCVYINKISQLDFEEFLESNTDTLTNPQLFQLMESCIHPARKDRLKSTISYISLNNVATSSFDDLEKTFISAYRASEFDLAKTVLEQASYELTNGRFRKQHNYVFDERRKLVKCYKYKLDVTLLTVGKRKYDPNFQLHVWEIPIPFESSESRFFNECEHFRLYYLAYYLIDHDSSKSIRILKRLVKDTNNPEYLLMLLHVYISSYDEESNITLIRQTLTRVELFAKDQWSDIPSYPLPWVSGMLQAYLTIDDVTAMKQIWSKFSSVQKILPQLLVPYCNLLLKHDLVKEADIAFSSYMNFLGSNEELSDELDEISRIIMNALAKESSVTEYIDRIAEKNQRSPEQLATAFRIINGSRMEEYARITSACSVENYLIQTVIAVSKELLSRSKNFYVSYVNDDGSKPAKEDTINQWFKSLFNMRERHSPFVFSDQNQIGSSVSGKGPGEVDGVIEDNNQNRRIALFEAFRLLGWSSTSINEHMDKLSGYDREGLNIMFVVVYVFDKNFNNLLNKYKEHISKREHVGYIKTNDYLFETVNGEDSDTFWIGKEQRMRGNVIVSIYHMVINFNCDY